MKSEVLLVDEKKIAKVVLRDIVIADIRCSHDHRLVERVADTVLRRRDGSKT